MDPATGGINTNAGNPNTLVAEDEGYTFIDTNSGKIKRFKGTGDGTNDIDWEIAGGSGVESSGTEPTTPNEGDTWFNTTTNEFMVWNGTEWIPVSSGLDYAVNYQNPPDSELDPSYHPLESWKKRKVIYQSTDIRYFIAQQVFEEGTKDGITLELDSDGSTILKTFTKNKSTEEIVVT